MTGSTMVAAEGLERFDGFTDDAIHLGVVAEEGAGDANAGAFE